jgi:hypothetical protein
MNAERRQKTLPSTSLRQALFILARILQCQKLVDFLSYGFDFSQSGITTALSSS